MAENEKNYSIQASSIEEFQYLEYILEEELGPVTSEYGRSYLKACTSRSGPSDFSEEKSYATLTHGHEDDTCDIDLTIKRMPKSVKTINNRTILLIPIKGKKYQKTIGYFELVAITSGRVTINIEEQQKPQ